MKKLIEKGDDVECLTTYDDDDLTYGKIYKVIDARKIDGKGNGYVDIIDDRGLDNTFFESRFRLVKPVTMDFEKAGSLIGKKIRSKYWYCDSPTITSITTYKLLEESKRSANVISHHRKVKKDFIILVSGTLNVPMTDDITIVPDKPTEYDVKLNSEYTAKVTKDTIEVGCQTFPVSILKDLREAHNKL